MLTLFSIIAFVGWIYNFIECLRMVGTPLNKITALMAIKIGGIFFFYGSLLGWLEILGLVKREPSR